MPRSSDAAPAKGEYLWQQHPDWSHVQVAAALGCAVSWVEKWLNRFREELAAGARLDHVLQGHSRPQDPTTHDATAGGRADPGHP